MINDQFKPGDVVILKSDQHKLVDDSLGSPQLMTISVVKNGSVTVDCVWHKTDGAVAGAGFPPECLMKVPYNLGQE